MNAVAHCTICMFI